MYLRRKTLSKQPVLVFNHAQSRKHFLMFKWNSLSFNSWPLPSMLSVGTTEKGLAVFFAPPISYLFIPSFYHLCSRHWTRCSPCLFLAPRAGSTTPDVSHQCRAEGKDDLSWPVGNAPPNAAQDAVGFLFFKSMLLANVQLAIHSGYSGPFLRLTLNMYRYISLCWTSWGFSQPISQPVKVCLNGSTMSWFQSVETFLACCCGFGILHYKVLFWHGPGYKQRKVFPCVLFSINIFNFQ